MTGFSLLAAALFLAPTAPPPPVMVTTPHIIAGQISSADYPPAALRDEAEGRTHAAMTIDARGRVTRCSIALSSGHELLDRRVCDLALARMRFSPALDASGGPMTVNVVLPVEWKMEPIPPTPAP